MNKGTVSRINKRKDWTDRETGEVKRSYYDVVVAGTTYDFGWRGELPFKEGDEISFDTKEREGHPTELLFRNPDARGGSPGGGSRGGWSGAGRGGMTPEERKDERRSIERQSCLKAAIEFEAHATGTPGSERMNEERVIQTAAKFFAWVHEDRG